MKYNEIKLIIKVELLNIIDIDKCYDCLEKFIKKYMLVEYDGYLYYTKGCKFIIDEKMFKSLKLTLTKCDLNKCISITYSQFIL